MESLAWIDTFFANEVIALKSGADCYGKPGCRKALKMTTINGRPVPDSPIGSGDLYE